MKRADDSGEMHSKIWCKTHRVRPPRHIFYVDHIDPATGLVRVTIRLI